jgi:hypothetical protein
MSGKNHQTHDYLPPIRCSSPLHFSRSTSQSTLDEDQPEYDTPLSESPPSLGVVPEEPSESGQGACLDMRPTTPCSVFDRIMMPQAFVPTRRAPRPPQPQSWIDLSDDDDSFADRPAPRSRGVAPSPPHAALEDQSSHLEREIMRMLQFNEERDVEARIAEEKRKKRASNASLMGGLWGRLKRTASTAGIRAERPEGLKRASYFDYFG